LEATVNDQSISQDERDFAQQELDYEIAEETRIEEEKRVAEEERDRAREEQIALAEEAALALEAQQQAEQQERDFYIEEAQKWRDEMEKYYNQSQEELEFYEFKANLK